MTSPGRALFAVAALAVSTAPAFAQLVRGNVTDAGSNAPISGVLLTLVTERDSVVRSTLSDPLGRFQVLAPSAGRYTIQAKRIGVRRWTSEEFQVGIGETKSLSIMLEPVAAELPQVLVRSTALCVRNDDSAQQVAALWDEVSTALTATALTIEDSTHDATIVRSSRVLDPRTQRVLAERRLSVTRATGRPFSSIEPESLLTNGYWHEIDEDAVVFYGMDERVLNSTAFRAVNCFHVARRRPPSPARGSIGIGFEPIKTGNGVRGTIWLDSATFELREVEYSHTGVTRTQYSDQLGGLTRFGRLVTGGWIVRDWSMRMPQYAVFRTRTGGFERVYRSAVGSTIRVPTIQRVIEQGGSVHTGRLVAIEPPATIRGLVVDSLGKPLAAATISLVGTEVRATSGADGSFALASVAPGLYALAANDSTSADLGVHSVEQDVKVEPGQAMQVSLRFRKGRELLAGLCKRDDLPPDRSALRLRLLDSTTNQPIAGQQLRFWWTEYSTERGFRRASNQSVDGVTSEDGTVLVCGVPGNTDVNIGTALDHSRARPVGTVRLRPGSIHSTVVRTP